MIVHTLIYYVPAALLAFIMIALAVALSCGALFLVRRFVSVHNLKKHNDVAGFIFATVGVIYAVLLAFTVVVAWESFNNSYINVSKEANSIACLYRDSGALQPAFRKEVRKELKEYAQAIVDDEWPLLARGQRSEKVQKIQDRIWDLYSSYQPKKEADKVFFAESVRKLNEAAAFRRERILDAGFGIHPVLWFVIFAGGLITVSFAMFLGTENFTAQLVMTSLLSALIALILFTIMSLDYPFTGNVSISPATFRVVLQTLLK